MLEEMNWRMLIFALGIGMVPLTGSIGAVAAAAAPARAGDATTLAAPIHFANYRAVFQYIAKAEGLPSDDDTLFRLAADSSIEVHGADGKMPGLYVITAHYLAGGIYDQIRGASDNGEYFIVHSLTPTQNFIDAGNLDRGFELVGVAFGNTYRWEDGSITKFITKWHMSAQESVTSEYDWDGKLFRLNVSSKK